MKKILHINPQLEIIWWMERYIEQFYVSFCDIYDIYALSIEKHNISINLPKDRIYSLNEKIDNSLIKKIIKIFYRSKNIANFCNKKHIDISISHWDIANLFNILSKVFWNKSKIIIILHNAFDKNLLWIPLYYLCKFLYKYADEIISVSHELSNDLQKQINYKNIKTIYNPFNLENINKLKNENINSNNIKQILNNWKINICNVSRIEKYKKQDLIIKYFSEYYKIYKNIQLFFIWDWDKQYIGELEILIKKLWLKKNIFFLWFKNNIYKYLNKMNYYYYYWLQEWFGRSLIDALSCWVPVLTHNYKYWAKEIMRNDLDLSICKDIEIHKNGILTPYMDKEKYIKAMNILINTKFNKNKIIENTKKYNIEKFKKSWNLILK